MYINAYIKHYNTFLMSFGPDCIAPGKKNPSVPSALGKNK